ncbi:MAG: ROK family protein [Burkholderiales bacterium]|nr:ROK family protein [Burkholderiales bacterium]
MSTPHPFRFGIDLGGTKIELVALDLAGNECWRQRVATPAGDYVGTLRAIETLVRAAEATLGATGSVGIATPGAPSRKSGLIKNANSTCLNGQPLVQDLERMLARPIRIANDANCFALSEATDGAAAGAAVVFGVILGTGVGGGIVVNGQALDGANAIGGEWGHNPLPALTDAERRANLACYCGRTQCVETWLSGPGLAADHQRVTGETLTAADIAARAAAGSEPARATLARHAERLARALATVINILDPDVIVLGGGLANIRSLYDDVPTQWVRHIFSDHIATRLVPPQHGDSSGVRGAARLWPAG